MRARPCKKSRIATEDVCDRPRERILAYGVEQASMEELLATVLGTGTRGMPAIALGQKLLGHVGGLRQLSRASPQELMRIRGIGKARAVRLAAAFTLGRRVVQGESLASDLITSPSAAYRRLAQRCTGLTQEVFIVLALDVRCAVISELEIARGSLTSVEVHPREVFRPLIRLSAAAAVVAHNHPSGDPTPSFEDIELTNRLRAVGEIVGIPVLDHVILGDASYISIAEQIGADAPDTGQVLPVEYSES